MSCASSLPVSQKIIAQRPFKQIVLSSEQLQKVHRKLDHWERDIREKTPSSSDKKCLFVCKTLLELIAKTKKQLVKKNNITNSVLTNLKQINKWMTIAKEQNSKKVENGITEHSLATNTEKNSQIEYILFDGIKVQQMVGKTVELELNYSLKDESGLRFVLEKMAVFNKDIAREVQFAVSCGLSLDSFDSVFNSEGKGGLEFAKLKFSKTEEMFSISTLIRAPKSYTFENPFLDIVEISTAGGKIESKEEENILSIFKINLKRKGIRGLIQTCIAFKEMAAKISTKYSNKTKKSQKSQMAVCFERNKRMRIT